MRLREFLIRTAVMSLVVAPARALPANILISEVWSDDGPANASNRDVSPSLPPLPSPLIREDKVLQSAYYDTLSILAGNGPCSDFFGGSNALVVFNEF